MRHLRQLCPLALALLVGSLLALSEPGAGPHLSTRVAAAAPSLPCPPAPVTPGVPPPFPCEEEEAEESEEATVDPGDLCLSLRADPSGTVLPSQTVTYQLVVSNSGEGAVKHARLSFPFEPQQQTVLDVRFSDPSGWVSEVVSDAILFQIEALGSSEQLTATLRLRVQPTMPLDDMLTAQAATAWAATGSDDPIYSNRLDLVVSASPGDSAPAPLVIHTDPADPAMVTVTSDRFSSLEPVSLWYHLPDGDVVEAGEAAADQRGRLTTAINLGERATSDLRGRSAGMYWIVAHGQCSGITAAGEFRLQSLIDIPRSQML